MQFRIQFLDGSAKASARNVAGAIELVVDADLPPQPSPSACSTAYGREVHSGIRGRRRGGPAPDSAENPKKPLAPTGQLSGDMENWARGDMRNWAPLSERRVWAMDALDAGSPRIDDLRRDLMRTPDEVAAMVRLKGLGWGERRIAAELGCSRETVRRYVAGGFVGTGRRGGRSAGGREDLAGGAVSAPPRQRRRGAPGPGARARRDGVAAHGGAGGGGIAPGAWRRRRGRRVRFETPPGRQLQIDFGETRVAIGGESVRVYLFVATLGYSRRMFVQAFRHERQSAWFDGLEAAFRALRRGAAGGAAGQRAGAGDEHDAGDARGAVQRAAARVCALLGLQAAAPARRTGRGPRARTRAASAT